VRLIFLGVRLIFENSTAYRKSVPIVLCLHPSSRGVGVLLVHYEVDVLLARVDQVSFGGLLGCRLSIC